MKITILSSLPPTKGISKYTAGLLGALSGQCDIDAIGFRHMYPEFLYPGGTTDKSLKPLKNPKINVRNILTWYNPLGWIYAGLTAKGKIIHAQWWSYVLAPVYITVLFCAKYIRGRKVLITVHNVKPHEQGVIKNLANRSVFFLGDYFIVHSEANKKTFAKTFNKPAEKISVIPHGVLLPDAPKKGISKYAAQKHLGISNGSRTVLFFGIIRDYKGLDVLLEALATIRKELPKARLIIAGKPWESWEKYQNIIDKNNYEQFIKKDLRFIPEGDIEAYFQVADLVVLPYKHFDAQSGAGTLALPFGKAMVVTDTGGLPQLVKDPVAVARAKDSKDLAAKIAKVLSSKKLMNKLEKDSLSLSNELSWESISKRTLSLYEDILKRN